MATDGPTPLPCDKEVFQHGEGVCVVDGSSNAVERWVRLIAEMANARVDWHYSGGRASVLHLGDSASRQRVLSAIHEHGDALDGTILSVGGPALYRLGDIPADSTESEYNRGLRDGIKQGMEKAAEVAAAVATECADLLAMGEASNTRETMAAQENAEEIERRIRALMEG